MSSIHYPSGETHVLPLGTIVPATRTATAPATRTATARDPRAECLAHAGRLARLANDHGYQAEILETDAHTIRLNVYIDGKRVSRVWRISGVSYSGNNPSGRIRQHTHWFRCFGVSFDDSDYEPRCSCAAGYESWQLGLCGLNELELIIMTGHVPDSLVIPPEPVTGAIKCADTHGGTYYMTLKSLPSEDNRFRRRCLCTCLSCRVDCSDGMECDGHAVA